MSRYYSDWIKAYLEYTSDYEPPRAFNFWTAITILGMATCRQVWYPFGSTRIWPNLYVVFVGPSGCGKTQAMRKGKPLIDCLDIPMSPDKSTGAKLLHRMSQAVQSPAMTKDNVMKTPYLIYAEEFPSFLGDKAYTTGLLADLTALWDCPEPAWTKSTMKDDNVGIPNPYVCLLAGTTAQGLFDTLPHNTLGQGFTSRILFIYSEYNNKRVPMPPYNDTHRKRFMDLQEDLIQIQNVIGPFHLTPSAEELWTSYYNQRGNPADRFEDDRSQGFASREPIYVLKLSEIFSLAEGDDKAIKVYHVQNAIDTLATVTEQLPLVYATMTQSPVIGTSSTILKLIELAGPSISHQVLYRKLRYRLDPIQFRMALDGLIQAGMIEKGYPTGGVVEGHFW